MISCKRLRFKQRTIGLAHSPPVKSPVHLNSLSLHYSGPWRKLVHLFWGLLGSWGARVTFPAMDDCKVIRVYADAVGLAIDQQYRFLDMIDRSRCRRVLMGTSEFEKLCSIPVPYTRVTFDVTGTYAIGVVDKWGEVHGQYRQFGITVVPWMQGVLVLP